MAETIVTSPPSRRTAASPSAAGAPFTSPSTVYRRLCSRKITGLSSSIAARRSPFASAGVEGATILIPGMPVSQETGICEWMAPKRPPAPTTERIVTGTLTSSWVRNQYFDIWFTSPSMTSVRKSPNMISITGRSPLTAEPNAAPARASSEIGVSKTRSSPYFSYRPGVTANTPPAIAMSSPKKTTRSSAASASSSASRMAVRKSVISRAPARGGT